MDETAVANLALGRLGIGKTISALTDNTVEAKTCNRFFAQCRREVLRAHPWGFGLKAEPLALVADQVFPGWAYVYQYPSGCLVVRAIADVSGLRLIRDQFFQLGELAVFRQLTVPWQVALRSDAASKVLLCDLASAWAFHTFDVSNIGVWDDDAVSVLAWRLAMEVGGPLSAKAELISQAGSQYLAWMRTASANNMNEQKDDTRPESPSITCRY